MQVGDGADGIQKLLKAEQEAQRIISAARQEKSNKIKQAQREAEQELATIKATQDDKYKKLLEQGKGDAQGRLSKLESETGASIKDLQSSVGGKKSKVVDDIVSWVTKVR